MNFQFSHPHWLWLLLPVWGWILWLARTSHVQLSPARRWFVGTVRMFIGTALVLALAGIQWMRPIEGMNVMFLLDRSDSVPAAQQDKARSWLNRISKTKPQTDRAGAVVFGADAAIEASAIAAFDLQQVQAVIPTEGTDIAGAIQLATAAFPETGQRRLVLLSDGNENTGDALNAAYFAGTAGVSIDVVPLTGETKRDAAVQRVDIPSHLGKGQPFEVKVFVQAEAASPAAVRLYRNDQFLGEQKVELEPGKNLFTFSQTLPDAGFYSYDIRVDAPGDAIPQNNRAFGFAWVRGVPRVLMISTDPESDAPLAEALKSETLEVNLTGLKGLPASLAEWQSYDSIFFCNVAAGDLSREELRLLESAVRDFGVGFVCVGGDDTYAAGAYRGTPLATILPVDMELSSKKVIPPGALVLIIDQSGSMAGEKLEMARQAAMGAVSALSDNDYVAVIAFDGAPHLIVDLQKASNRGQIMRQIAGIGNGGGTVMYPAMAEAYKMLKDVKATLKHCVILTDGVSQPDDFEGLSKEMAENRITITTVGIGPDSNGGLLQQIATLGKGRFYAVPQPTRLPQIFIKETAIILKTAINEESFTPRLVSSTEPVRGIGAGAYPPLLGYVTTEPRPRAETPLVTDKGDPLLAHWQYGLGRTVAFTSDARAKWAKNWLGWPQYQQFWRQIAHWSLRRLANADFVAATHLENGRGSVTVEALTERGDYKNYLNLQATVVSPKGDKQTITLAQTSPGHYEANFPARETGAYLLNVLQMENGQPVGSQITGAGVACSPEVGNHPPNLGLLKRIAAATGGRMLDPAGMASSPFHHERKKTWQAQELWQWLLKFTVLAFVIEVGVRRIEIGMEEWQKFFRRVAGIIPFLRVARAAAPSQPSLAALLARRDEVRVQTPVATVTTAQPTRIDATKPLVSPPPPAASQPPSEASTVASPEPEPNTTDRLLEAKRRAQRRH